MELDTNNNNELSIQCTAYCEWRNVKRCQNQINFANKSQFDSYRDKDNKKIYYYRANHHAFMKQQKSDDKDTYFSYESVYGNKVRIFCCSCYHRLRRCKFDFDKKHKRCDNKDRNFILGILFTYIPYWYADYDVIDVLHEICRNHAVCTDCGKALAYKAMKCKKCKKLFCIKPICYDSRNKLCKNCSITDEYKAVYVSIKMSFDSMHLPYDVDVNILKLITENAMGIGILCCNKDDKCYNDIICNNKYEFRNKIDFKSHKIHHYKPKYLNPQQKPTAIIDNERLRVFCSQCTSSKIKRCTKQKKMTYGTYYYDGYILCENHNESGDGICGNHPFCGKCQCQKKDSLLNKCNKCHRYFCESHILNINKKKKLCEECMFIMDLRDLWRTIKLALKYMDFDDDGFVYIIASYASGRVLICSNKECEHEIT